MEEECMGTRDEREKDRKKTELKDERRLVPSCFVIFDLEPLSLSFDFVFMSEIFKSLSFCLDRLCCFAILCLDQHAHSMHHLESLLTISLDRLDIFEGRSCISEFVRKDFVIKVCFPAKAYGLEHNVFRFSMLLDRLTRNVTKRQTTRYRVNQIDTIYLIMIVNRFTDLYRYPVDIILIHVESRKSPTAVLFVVDIGGIFILHCETKEYHSECSGKYRKNDIA
ncbi:hypothetical protein Tco_0599057 [Tanacetum coccineum]